ncbi:MAG: transporter substrate-binding domain-containing protein [Methylocystis sp.]
MTSACIFRRLAIFATCVAPLSAAMAQNETRPSTLQQVQKRGAVSCAVAAPSPGFAQQNEAGAWSGFDIDFCKALAAAIFDDPGKIRIVAPAPKERLGALQSGAVDVLLPTAPWTQARDAGQQMLHATIRFFGGQGLLTRRRSDLHAASDIDDISVCVQQGTSQELDLADYFHARKQSYRPQLLPSLDEASKAYDAGKCDALTADVAALHVARSRMARAADHMVLADMIAKAPIGPIVRQGDDQWFNIIRWAHFAMVDAEELNVSKAGADEALQSENTDVRRLLGVEGDFGEGLGLSGDWAYRVIKHVGNYGDVFERDLGQGSPLAMERRQNALWSKGGLMYAPPAR